MIGNHLEPFKFWCQKVLPNVYDDSLSYYEYLCKLNEYLNEVIEQINTLTDNMSDYETDLTTQWTTYRDELSAQWQTYKTYIDNYFDNLNVQTEINNKLDAMATDGTLSALIEPFIGNDIQTTVTNWLTANVDPVGSAVTVDSSLSISGSAADAKVVGDRALLCDGYIDTNTDLNDILHNGFYTVLPNRTLTHAPDNYATSSALLIVYATVNNSETAQLTQIYVNYTKNTIHQRVKSANDSFGNWKLVNVDTTGFDTLGYMDSNTDLNNCVTNGYYAILSNRTLTNAPSDYANSYSLLVVYNASENNASTAEIVQLYFNYTKNTTWIRTHYVNGAFASWKQINVDHYGFTTKGYIDTNTDLNTFTTEGYYLVLSNRTLINAPSDYNNSNGLIANFPSVDANANSQKAQMFWNYTTGSISMRLYSASDTSWSNWKKLNDYVDNKGFCALGYMQTNEDLDTFLTEGYYTILSNRTLTHAPSDYQDSNSVLLIYPTVSTSTVAQITQVYINFTKNTTWLRMRSPNASTFSDWKCINPKQNFLQNGKVLAETNFSSSYTGNNYGTNLDILIYNVAHYSKYTGHKIGDSGYENYLTNFKKLLQHINPDVCFIEEDTQYTDTNSTKASESYLYNNLLPVSTGYSETTIKSKIAFDDVQDDHTSETRPSIYAVWNSLNGKKVLLYCAHLVPSDGAETTRLAELEHIFSVINTVNPDAFIVCGDFNTLSATDRSNLISVCETNNARYGNGSWLGWIDTTQGYSTDNIIVSNNVFINKFEVMSELYDELFSDHNPVAVNITIKDT